MTFRQNSIGMMICQNVVSLKAWFLERHFAEQSLPNWSRQPLQALGISQMPDQ
jgi:hypothetical protein